MTLPFDFYPWFALAASVGLTVLFCLHGRHVIARYRSTPRSDVNSSASLLATLVLVVAGIGLTVSALGVFDPVGRGMSYAVVGLSITRGALLVGSMVLVVIDRHRR